jgi:hypothetical protein
MTTWQELKVEMLGERQSTCECCQNTTQRVWGWISGHNRTLAAYYVTFTSGRPDHGAKFQLIVGSWGEGTTFEDRIAVELDCRVSSGKPAFMVVDASPFPTVAARSLKRREVIGTELSAQVFPMVDAIYMNDPRLDEIRQWSHPAH